MLTAAITQYGEGGEGGMRDIAADSDTKLLAPVVPTQCPLVLIEK
jgi:hypothetical protein